MTLHSGIDLVHIPRITRLANRYGSRFYQKIFTSREQDYVLSQPQRLAGCWAAKEAVVKALGTGWHGISYRDIEICSETGRAPGVQLYHQAHKLGGTWQWSLSISHDGDYAVAAAVALS